MTKWNISDEAATLHEDALVWDMTLPWSSLTGLNITSMGLKHSCIRSYAEHGANMVSLTVAGDDGIEKTIRTLAKERAYFLKNSEKYVLVETADDILKARKEGKLAVGFHFQGSLPVDRELGLVELYYKLGVRHMLLAYNQKNFVGDGAHERTDAGLSIFGVRMIKEMNQVGMIVDCAHSGYRTSMDAMEVSEATTIFSHANAKGVYDHPRNIRDDQAKTCAASGGVIGVNGISIFLNGSTATPEDLFKHIDYFANMVGSEHVGLGLDHVYDAPSLIYFTQLEADRWPASGGYSRPDVIFYGPKGLPQLTEVMLTHGYGEADIRGILGENWLRVCKQIWK